jgi:hypothetical protein
LDFSYYLPIDNARIRFSSSQILERLGLSFQTPSGNDSTGDCGNLPKHSDLPMTLPAF